MLVSREWTNYSVRSFTISFSGMFSNQAYDYYSGIFNFKVS